MVSISVIFIGAIAVAAVLVVVLKISRDGKDE